MTSESVWHIPFNVCTALKMAQNTKKNRYTNWTPEEKEYLFSILTPQLLAIIENKENDSNANKRKSAAWKSVYESFISKYGIYNLQFISHSPASSGSISNYVSQFRQMKLLSENAFAREH